MSKKTEGTVAEDGATQETERLKQNSPASPGLSETEAHSQSVAKSPGTRVPLAEIEDRIIGQFYMTGYAFAEFANGGAAVNQQVADATKALTICVLVVDNGFSVIGKAAPADPVNYDAETGRRYAYEDAVRQLWPLFGFALREKLAAR